MLSAITTVSVVSTTSFSTIQSGLINFVKIVADLEKISVSIEQIGSNPSSAAGKTLSKGEVYNAKHNDVIEVLTGSYEYKINFDPPPDKKSKKTEEKDDKQLKRKREENPASENGTKKNRNALPDGKWQNLFDNTLLVYDTSEVKSSSKVASYDMDGTIILTKSGRVFAVNDDDWKIIFNEVPKKLKQLISNGYKIVIFSNQAGIVAGKQTIPGIQKKFDNIRESLGIPMQMFIAAGKNQFRKPYIAMWEYMESNFNDGVKIDLDSSCYVGDAAGRPEVTKKKKKDFSCSDRLFALNLGLPFFTPEEHFLKVSKEKFSLPEFDPRKLLKKDTDLFEPSDTKTPKLPQEVIVLVGFPGSGKSFLAKHHFSNNGYVAVNRDTLGSWQKCVSAMEKHLDDGKNVVIDNTNPDVESRKRFVEAAKAKNIPIRCFVVNATKDHARHNNKFREFTGEDHAKINDMIFNSYKSKYEEPSLTEKFEDIVKVNFVPQFKNEDHKKIYHMFLLDK